jgi:Xaa-Pro aminopeptidase
MGFAKAGRHEYQVQGVMEYIFKNSGALSSAYNSIVASGDNANTLHYVENNKLLKDGDLLLIDAGCEYQYYASDITRTFPINGKFSGAQKEIYEIVLKAQKSAFSVIKIAAKPSEIHKAACQEIIKGLIDLKFLNGSIDEHFNKTPSEFRDYYPHGTGHWLGLDVHDDNTYYQEDGTEMGLIAGSVFTVEPGIYLDHFRHNIPEKYRGIGVRIEDDIHITETGFENLSIDAPKEILEVEAACAINYNDFI